MRSNAYLDFLQQLDFAVFALSALQHLPVFFAQQEPVDLEAAHLPHLLADLDTLQLSRFAAFAHFFVAFLQHSFTS
jgi:hypothetical protein